MVRPIRQPIKYMYSKVKFDIDEDNNPCIVAEIKHSDDVRDKIAARFFERLGENPILCKVSETGNNTLCITPMSPLEVHTFIKEAKDESK